eukprot:TRINITY_DN4934_c0_g1_i3.p1 TRINITY_DN4934_c0_g1~~TRINITY_DN4934_c0_g1_i3.p1  ORF type:complete len:405 (+),score=87.39 TRINITY_DN4934_c0_g1_i3:54-1268(+)
MAEPLFQTKTSEFQAVILAAGKGHYLYPLTERISKPLLPLANRPLISYPLSLLEKAGFTDVIIITTQAAQSPIRQLINERYNHKIKPHFKIVDEEMGSARALLLAKELIKTDFFVLSADMISDVPLQVLADSHRMHQSTVTIYLRDKSSDEKGQGSSKKSSNASDDLDYVAYDPKSSRVAFIQNIDNIQEEEIAFPTKILRKIPNLTFHSKMQDMHLYVFSRWVLELLEMNPRLESLRLHLIPYLVKKQFSNYAVEGNVRKLPESAFANQGTALADWSHLQAFRESAREIVKCYAHVSREGICYRINNTEAYLEALRDIAKIVDTYSPWENVAPSKVKIDKYVDQSVDLHQRSTIGPECVVGHSTKIGEKSSLKKSIVGNHCVIGANVKITNSIIMAQVRINDG